MDDAVAYLAALRAWVEPFAAAAVAHSTLAAILLVGLLLFLVIAAGGIFGMVEAGLLALLALLALWQDEVAVSAALLGVGFLLAVANLRHRKYERMSRETKWQLTQLNERVDDFLVALDRRSRQLDLALASSAAERIVLPTQGAEPPDPQARNGSEKPAS